MAGDRFWDREPELEMLSERLREGAHLLITAPRRIGKTSLMREAARRFEREFLFLYIDLQKAQSAADAIAEIATTARPHASLWEKTKGVFKNLGNSIESLKVGELNIKLRGGLTAGDWAVKGDELLDAFAEHDPPVVLLLDELPILVNRLIQGSEYQVTPERTRATDEFLSWLRATTVRHQDKIRVVVAGSIGLEPIVHQAGLSATLNTFTAFPLGPWTEEAAAGCLRALATNYNIGLGDEVIHAMLERIGMFIPHHVQMFFDHIYQACRMQSTRMVTLEMVDGVYQHSMLSLRGHVELSHMEERLRMVLGPELQLLAISLLTETAVAGKLTIEAASLLVARHCPESAAESLRRVLAILEHDGYLQKKEAEYRFASRLLKDWWKARFSFGYEPPGPQPR